MKYFFALIFLALSSITLHSATEKKIIEVFGESELNPYADTWEIFFTLNIQDINKSTVNNRYNKTITNIKNLLKKNNVNPKTMITESLFTSEWKEWTKNSYKVKGWQMNQSFSILIEDVDLSQKVLSSLTLVENISLRTIKYGLKKSTRADLLKTLYSEAHANALVKINAIVSALNVKGFEIEHVSENTSSMQPVFRGYESSPRVASLGSDIAEASIEITPKKMQMNLKLKVIAKYM